MFQAFNTVFTKDQIAQAQNLYASFTDQQKTWLSGYLAGFNTTGAFLGELFSGVNTGETEKSSSQNVIEPKELTILYGTHTGNAEGIGKKVLALAENQGLKVNLVSMPDYKSRKLKSEQNLLVIVSTHGDGEPPAAAEDFYNYLYDKKAPRNIPANYAVIALGDSSYFQFCKTGKDIDAQLESLGGSRLHSLVELDVDFKDKLPEVLPAIVNVFNNGDNHISENKEPLIEAALDPDEWVEVEVLDKILLNGRGSEKETYHIELDIEDTGITYQPGDALEVKPMNSLSLVKQILKELELASDLTVEFEGERVLLEDCLLRNFELTVVSPIVIRKYAEIANNQDLDELVADGKALRKYLYGSDFLDLIKQYPTALSPLDLVSLLRKLPARLYSISSSYNYNPDEVDITVGAVRYELNDREHNGVCSGFLADQIQVGHNVWIRVKKNEGFRLPEQNDAKVIMIGPGTGIAPFRSFLQERETANSDGDNWLFFGDQHFETDFLYQRELLDLRKNGVLNQLSVAFSRDQKEKIYVQHQLQKHGEEVYKWLNEGAYIYLCGDKDRMAKDVKKELVNIICTHGKFSIEKAEGFLKELRTKKRFQEDVY